MTIFRDDAELAAETFPQKRTASTVSMNFVSDPHRPQDDLIDQPDVKSLFRDPAAFIPHLRADIGILIKKQHYLRNVDVESARSESR